MPNLTYVGLRGATRSYDVTVHVALIAVILYKQLVFAFEICSIKLTLDMVLMYIIIPG